MPLTPTDVVNKRFTLRRFGGYDADEVDGFLDQVEAELIRLRHTGGSASDDATDAPDPALAGFQHLFGDELAKQGVLTLEEGQQISLRTLLTSHRTAELLLGEAKLEAERRVAAAVQAGEQLISAARERAAQHDLETADRVAETLAALEARRAAIEARLAELYAFEAGVRSRLEAHLHMHLQSLEQLHAGLDDSPPGIAPDSSSPTGPAGRLGAGPSE